MIKTRHIFLLIVFCLSLSLVASKIVLDKTGSSGFNIFLDTGNPKDIAIGSYIFFEQNNTTIERLKNAIFIKKIVYIGDDYTFTKEGVYIQSKLVGKLAKKGIKHLKPKRLSPCIIALNNQANSYDSRYFGCVDPLKIKANLTPLF